MAAFAGKHPRGALASLGGRFSAKELEWTMFDGEPFYLATDEKGSTLIVPVTGRPSPEFESEHVMRMVHDAAGAEPGRNEPHESI